MSEDEQPYPRPMQPTRANTATNIAWTVAMANALGADSGFAVPLVPDVEAFRRLFRDIRQRLLHSVSAPPTGAHIEASYRAPAAQILPADLYREKLKAVLDIWDDRYKEHYVHGSLADVMDEVRFMLNPHRPTGGGVTVQREHRYTVLKIEDIQNALDADQTEALIAIEQTITEYRKAHGKKPDKEYVVVAEDWPMYEQTWRAIEQWVDLNEAKKNEERENN